MTNENQTQNDSDASSLRERTLAQIKDSDERRRFKAITDLQQTHLSPREWSA